MLGNNTKVHTYCSNEWLQGPIGHSEMTTPAAMLATAATIMTNRHRINKHPGRWLRFFAATAVKMLIEFCP